MNADYLCKEETETIIGCAFAILNEIGHGFHEKPYENSLVPEFDYGGIDYLQQSRFSIIYRGKQVAEYISDLIAYNKVIVDTKVIERMTDHEIGQMINHLKITGLHVGLIPNSKSTKLEFRRVVGSTQNFIRHKPN